MNEKTAVTEEKLSPWKRKLKNHIPILRWLRHYKKKDLVADLIAGLTVGLTLIPQSVAYAGLAGLSPEYGLYSSFMGSFIYLVFGTVKEVSIGPTSLISLLTFEFSKDLSVEYVFLLTFMCGFVELFLGLLQFGFLVNFISLPVTTSFQSATSLIIISSQLKDLLGVPKFKSGRFLSNVISVGERIKETRIGDVVLSIFCCTFLLLLRKLKDLSFTKKKELSSSEKILKKTLWFISISRNAFCVLISCVFAYIFSKYGQTPFKLSGSIPSGLPPLRIPWISFQNGNETTTITEAVYQISSGILVIPLISILANVTIAKAFSVGYPVNATQEMITLGLCNISGSFVGSLPTCGAFTRSAVSNSSGIRTPLAGLFTGTLIILVIKFLTPYFYYIPKATLASILVCAVIFMIDWQTALLLWKINKTDFLCFMVTFVACLILGIQVGLLFGVIVHAGYLLYLWARPTVSVEVLTTVEGSYYKVKPDVGLYFPATDFIQNIITNQCVQNIPVVIDCLHFKGLDYTTARAIKDVEQHCKKRGQKLLFINMNNGCYKFLKNSNINMNIKPNKNVNEILFDPEEQELFAAVLIEESFKNKLNDSKHEQEPLLKHLK